MTGLNAEGDALARGIARWLAQGGDVSAQIFALRAGIERYGLSPKAASLVARAAIEGRCAANVEPLIAREAASAQGPRQVALWRVVARLRRRGGNAAGAVDAWKRILAAARLDRRATYALRHIGRAARGGDSDVFRSDATRLHPPPGALELTQARTGAAIVSEALALSAVSDEVRRRPYHADTYQQLAQTLSGPRRAVLLEAAAVLADPSQASRRPPRLVMTEHGRRQAMTSNWDEGLGRVFDLAGPFLCHLISPSVSGGDSPPDDSAQVAASARALYAAAQVLGVRPPKIRWTLEDAPPFVLEYRGVARLAISSAARHRALHPAELRFFAGRSLFSATRPLIALRVLELSELMMGLEVLHDIFRRRRSMEERQARALLTPQAYQELGNLLHALGGRFQRRDVERLMMAARVATNNAGFIASGSLGASLNSLRQKRGPTTEVAELVSFAVAEAVTMAEHTSVW